MCENRYQKFKIWSKRKAKEQNSSHFCGFCDGFIVFVFFWFEVMRYFCYEKCGSKILELMCYKEIKDEVFLGFIIFPFKNWWHYYFYFLYNYWGFVLRHCVCHIGWRAAPTVLKLFGALPAPIPSSNIESKIERIIVGTGGCNLQSEVIELID